MAVEGAPVKPDRMPVTDRSAAPAPPADLAAHVREEQRLVDRLLAYRPSRRRGSAGGRQEQPGDGDLGPILSGDATDPEFRKNLLIYRRLVGEAAYLHARARLGAARPDAAAVGDRADELRARATLPTDLPLTLKTLLAHRFELEQLLIELGDEDYITARLADVYDETGTHATWQDLYGRQLPALLPGPVGTEERPADGERVDRAVELEGTRRRLSRLMHVKQAEDEVFRARQELKRRAALLVTVVLGAVAVLFGAAVAWVVDDDRPLAAAVAAGAAGAALGGLFTLRDQVNLGAQLRQFWPFFCGQVVVGAVAGLLAFLVDQSGVLDVGGEDLGMAALAFAVGFSEAALLGLLGKLAGPFGGAGAPDRTGR
jgi:hypothetical protein